MREIKFRGYAIEELCGSQWVNNGFGVTKIDYTDGTSSVHLLAPYGDYQVVEESVGQFTGIKDKNGKEIYEGDIVKTTGMINNIGSVVFKDCEFCIELKHDVYGTHWHCLKVKDKYNDGKSGFEFKKTFEVIGNIYENKYLLKNR